MTGPPLDLRAVDVAVERAEYTWGRDHEVVALLRTLRDQVRALRAALATVLQHGRSSISVPWEVFKERNAAWERAAAVLAEVKDE